MATKKVNTTSEKPEVVKKQFEAIPLSNKAIWIALATGIFVFSYLRLRLASMPLERDEGEYAYMGQLLLDGVMPYKTACNMKLPGTYFFYALIELLFGKTATGIHIGVWVLNVATVLLFFAAIKRLFNPTIGLITALSFGFLSISDNFLGFAGHATHFVTFFVAMALFFFSNYSKTGNALPVFLMGLSFGMAFLMKQQAVFFLIFGGGLILVQEYSTKSSSKRNGVMLLLIYSAAVFIPYLLVVLLMMVTHNFDNFWFWTYEYARSYTTQLSFADGVYKFKKNFGPIFSEFLLFWLFAFAGMGLLFLSKFNRKQKFLALTFFLFAFLSACPGYFFREHYFIPLIPAAALMAGIGIDFCCTFFAVKLQTKQFTYVPILLLAFIFSLALAAKSVFYITGPTDAVCRVIYPFNPFCEAVSVGEYIHKNSSVNDKIAILGSEPEMLFYADRKSATKYIYTYDLMLKNAYSKKMNQEMIAELELAKPLFVVFCNMKLSWIKTPDSPTDLFVWFYKNIIPNYEMVGLADVVEAQRTNYYWGEEANRKPDSPEFVAVLRRK